jgi:Ca-activated chloride channel family protein
MAMAVRHKPGVLVAVLAAAAVMSGRAQGPTDLRPTFRASVDLVSVAAVVRDRRGEVVRNLSRDDFEVFDSGVRRPIVEFTPSDDGPVSLALLVDVSGSMAMGNLASAKQALDILLQRLRPGIDEVALFTFDKRLHEDRPFGQSITDLRASIETLRPYGVTSLYDAIGETAGRLQSREFKRRAILVVTDGLDNGSRLTPAEVSGLASATDVPVYVLSVVSPVDHEAVKDTEGRVTPAGQLSDLARWTGGQAFVVSAPAHASVAAQQLLAELRHQYLLAFEAGAASGWRPLDIRLRKRDLTIRARSGYFAAGRLG